MLGNQTQLNNSKTLLAARGNSAAYLCTLRERNGKWDEERERENDLMALIIDDKNYVRVSLH